SYINEETIKESKYNLTLNKAVDIQMKASPQTDKNHAYVSKTYIKNNKVTASTLNVRSGAGTNYTAIGQLSNGATVKIVDEYNGWYVIEYKQSKKQWVKAGHKEVRYYLDPRNFLNNE